MKQNIRLPTQAPPPFADYFYPSFFLLHFPAFLLPFPPLTTTTTTHCLLFLLCLVCKNISGLILTGIFAQQSIIGLSYPAGATDVPLGGWLDGNYRQVLVQLAAIGSVTVWSFVVTYGILVVMNKIPGLRLRLKDDEEELGTDMAQMGETAYGFMPLLMRNPDEESGLGSVNSKGVDENNSAFRLNNLADASLLAVSGGAGTPASSGVSTLGKGLNAELIRAKGSTTTLNLDLHVPRSDEDENHPKRLPQMTEGPANRQSNRISRVPTRHDKNDYTEDSTESDGSSEGR